MSNLFHYINGWNVSKLDVLLNGSNVDSFTFPIENVSGKKETIQDDLLEHRLINNGEIKQQFRGTHLLWEIPYEEWAKKETMKIMKKLRDYRKTNLGYQFILTPNIDVEKRIFDVLLYNEKIVLGIEAVKETAGYNTGVMFSFISRFWVDENWIDKDEIPYMSYRNTMKIGIF